MCCFSRPVELVSETKIFARASGGRQLLVYEMRLHMDQDLAMILPLPVPARSAEDAVRFINLESASHFFSRLDRLFHHENELFFSSPGPAPAAPLAVYDVGCFEASFVPGVDKFDRLDPRFRLPRDVWARAPQYSDWGFAVFQLKAKVAADPGWQRESLLPQSPQAKRPGSTADAIPRDHDATGEELPTRLFHPMAFEFPRRDVSRLFFPTLHIHDGAIHPQARFDHALYGQVGKKSPLLAFPPGDVLQTWQRSFASAAPGTAAEAKLLTAGAPVLRCILSGLRTNEDTWLADG